MAVKYTITLKGTGTSTNLNITLNGTVYYNAKTLTVERGTTFMAQAMNSDGGVYLNGVATGQKQYTHTVNSDVTVEFKNEGTSTTKKTVYITELALDPTKPVGDHNVFINGATYALESGQGMVGGTVYEIKQGYTLVNGTAYEIVFSSPVTVSWSGTFDSSRGYIEIDGTEYTSKGSKVYEQPPSIYVYVNSAVSKTRCYVELNGTTVQKGSGGYTFTPDAGSTVTIKMHYSNDSFKYYFAVITTS